MKPSGISTLQTTKHVCGHAGLPVQMCCGMATTTPGIYRWKPDCITSDVLCWVEVSRPSPLVLVDIARMASLINLTVSIRLELLGRINWKIRSWTKVILGSNLEFWWWFCLRVSKFWKTVLEGVSGSNEALRMNWCSF